MAAMTLEQLLDSLATEGELYTQHADGSVTCYACGHRCLIKPGRRGICKVRFNEDGVLKVPRGYVGALQCDPTEKKPFFHVYPGSDTLTFGMLGCDLHCVYCFSGDTPVITGQGPQTLEEVFWSASRIERTRDAEIAFPSAVWAVTASGALQKVRAVFKHSYSGQLTVIRPYYLPPLRCTPDHRVYATDAIARPPQLVYARELTDKHYLAIPRRHSFSSPQVVDVVAELGDYQVTYRVPWNLSLTERDVIAKATAQGVSSREIGAQLGKSSSYIRHVRSKLARGRGGDVRSRGPIIEEDTLRFPNEHRPGLPVAIALDEAMARLLGYFCADD